MAAPVYEPEEDSYFLLDVMKAQLAPLINQKNEKTLSFLDMGAGSGILGFEAAKIGFSVTLIDINPAAIEYMNLLVQADELPVSVIESDLFEQVPRQQFDAIVFNTPYLPAETGFSDMALHGGKNGHETACRFLRQAKNYLKPSGQILLLTSSLAQPEYIEQAAWDEGYSCELIALKSLFFEELRIYKLSVTTE